jgi:hypothetical protein
MQVEVPGLRPAVISSDAIAELHELRRFRHFFRNAYVLEFDAGLVRGHAERLERIHPRIGQTVDAFRVHLDRTLQSLSGSP